MIWMGTARGRPVQTAAPPVTVMTRTLTPIPGQHVYVMARTATVTGFRTFSQTRMQTETEQHCVCIIRQGFRTVMITTPTVFPGILKYLEIPPVKTV